MNNYLYDQGKLFTLQQLLCNKFDELFEALEVSLQKSGKMFYGPCPVHGGDNTNAFNMYHGGDVPGKWFCNTRHCEDTFKKSLLGFVRGMLSRNRFDWERKTDKIVSFSETVNWCCKFVGQKFNELKVDENAADTRGFISAMRIQNPLQGSKQRSLSRVDVRNRLTMPSEYFMGRGYSSEVLNRYDVGECYDKTKPFYHRAVVPIYDEDYRDCIGFTARSLLQACDKCQLYHHGGCPANELERWKSAKWINSKGFSRERHLYNYWFAKKAIKKTKVAFLVESPGSVWKLESNGFEGSLGLLGNTLSDSQSCLIEICSPSAIVVLTDNDLAGRQAAQKLAKQLEFLYQVFVPELPAADLGEMKDQEVRMFISGVLDKVRKRI